MGLAAQSALTVKLPPVLAAVVPNNPTSSGDGAVAPGGFATVLGAIAVGAVKPGAGRATCDVAASPITAVQTAAIQNPVPDDGTAKTIAAQPSPSVATAPPTKPVGDAKGTIIAGKSAGKSPVSKSAAALKSVPPNDPVQTPPPTSFPVPIANLAAPAPVPQSNGGGRNSPLDDSSDLKNVSTVGTHPQANVSVPENAANLASTDAVPHSQVATDPASFVHLINDSGTVHAAAISADVTHAVGIVSQLTAAPLTHQPAHNVSATAVPLPLAHAPAAMQASAAMVRFISNADGKQTMNVQLAPEELGKLQISVTRGPEGNTAITVTAERSDTLALLVRDQASLQTSLDQAGVSSEGRTLSFGLSGQDLGGSGGSSGFTGRGSAPAQYYGDHSDGNSIPVVPVPVSPIGLVNITA
jgi:flagellar hook-length control protein FliK